jgi:hypothetical protein
MKDMTGWVKQRLMQADIFQQPFPYVGATL